MSWVSMDKSNQWHGETQIISTIKIQQRKEESVHKEMKKSYDGEFIKTVKKEINKRGEEY